MADDMVTVSIMEPIGLRDAETGEVTSYWRGHQKMPREHARLLGLLHRIVNEEAQAEDEPAPTGPFGGAFSESLTAALQLAGYADLEALGKASRDELLAINGVGPAAYENIRNVLVMQGMWTGQ